MTKKQKKQITKAYLALIDSFVKLKRINPKISIEEVLND
jgi:hypothetical protein